MPEDIGANPQTDLCWIGWQLNLVLGDSEFMIHRSFGKTEVQVSQLGFGCMRFPLFDENDFKSINEQEAARMLLCD